MLSSLTHRIAWMKLTTVPTIYLYFLLCFWMLFFESVLLGCKSIWFVQYVSWAQLFLLIGVKSFQFNFLARLMSTWPASLPPSLFAFSRLTCFQKLSKNSFLVFFSKDFYWGICGDFCWLSRAAGSSMRTCSPAEEESEGRSRTKWCQLSLISYQLRQAGFPTPSDCHSCAFFSFWTQFCLAFALPKSDSASLFLGLASWLP